MAKNSYLLMGTTAITVLILVSLWVSVLYEKFKVKPFVVLVSLDPPKIIILPSFRAFFLQALILIKRKFSL